jgi:hypothetical protein
VFKEAYTMMTKNAKLLDSGRLRFKNKHQKNTWVKEMTLRSRGMLKVVKKYVSRKSGCPKWVHQLDLPKVVLPDPRQGDAAAEASPEGEREFADEGDDVGDDEDDPEEEFDEDEDESGEEEQGGTLDTVEETPDTPGAASSAAPATESSSGAAAAAESAKGEEGPPGDGVEYDIGWDVEKRRSWRLPLGAKRSQHKEFAIEMKPPKDGNKFGPMQAVFQDGTVVDVAITLEEFQCADPAAQTAAGGGARGRGRGGRGHGRQSRQAATSENDVQLFKGARDDDDVDVHFRANDRNINGDIKKQRLCCIRSSGKQLMQIDVKHFRTKDDMSDLEVDRAAVAWLNSLCEKYVKKELDVDGMIEIKTKFLEDLKMTSGEAASTSGIPAKKMPKKKAKSKAKATPQETALETAATGAAASASEPSGPPVAHKPPVPKELPAHLKAMIAAGPKRQPAMRTPSPKRPKTEPAEQPKPLITPPRFDEDD